MGFCLTDARRARIKARITQKEAQLTALNTSYDAAISKSEISQYRFDSGEGSQSAKRRDPADILKSIASLESQLEYLYRQLNGGGLVRMNLRRRD